MSRVLSMLVAFVALTCTTRARAAMTCEPALVSWVARCASTQALSLEIAHCPAGRVVVRAPSGPLDVELGPASDQSFRRVAGIGLSPVGQFPDWEKEPQSRRNVLAALERCVTQQPDLPFGRMDNPGSPGRQRLKLPWLLGSAVVLLAAAAIARGKRRSRRDAGRQAAAPEARSEPASSRPWAAIRLQDAWLALGLATATWLLRWWVLPRAFFHQNGQGPLWVEGALSDHTGLAAYGPGYAELMGVPARLLSYDPEAGVFLASSLLGATLPCFAFVVARRLGVRRFVALALAAVPALDPVLGRLAQSETYFGMGAALTMAATAAVVSAPPRARWRSPAFVLAVVPSGLLVSQAVRVHPTAWPAACMVPLAVLLAPGSLRHRLRLTVAATVGVALVVAVTSGAALWQVVSGQVGQKWLPQATPVWSVLAPRNVVLALVAVVAVGLVLRSWRGVVIGFAAAFTLAAALLTDLLSNPNPMVTAAHTRLFAPTALVLVAAWLARRVRTPRRQRFWAPVLVTAALISAQARLALATTLPTDVLEARFAMGWRGSTERNATVASIARAGERVAHLPLYAGSMAAFVPVSEDSQFVLADLPQPAYYYRSTLCSTREGRPICQRLERGQRLELVDERELPARPSMRWHPYDVEPVKVALYRVRQ